MKIQALGNNPNAQCTVVEFNDCVLMLDCALELTSITRFAPSTASSSGAAVLVQFAHSTNDVFIRAPPRLHCASFALLGADATRVEAVLISHARHALALPFLMQRGFRGTAYATLPVIETLRQMFTELLDAIAALSNADYVLANADVWQRETLLGSLPPSLLSQLPDVMHWVAPLIDARFVDAALSCLVPVAFHEHVQLGPNVVVMPSSSGFALGAANWTIHTPNGSEKIVYMCDACSPALQRYPLPLDIDALRNANALIFAGANRGGGASTPAARFAPLLDGVDRVVRGGGCVLLPIYPSGVLFDLIVCFDQHFRTMNLHVPIVLLAGCGSHLVAFSDIAAEWVCEAMQARAHSSRAPFAFDSLIRRRSLLVHSTLEGADRALNGALLRTRGTAFDNLEAASANDGFDTTSCVVFAGDPSLRFGDTLTIMQLWRDEPRNAVVFVESEHDVDKLLVPFQPLSLQVLHCANEIDPRLSIADARRLLADVKPKRLVASTESIDLLGSDCVSGPVLVLLHADVVSLPIEHHLEQVFVDASFAASLLSTPITPSFARQLVGPVESATVSAIVAPFNAYAVNTGTSLMLKAAPIDHAAGPFAVPMAAAAAAAGAAASANGAATNETSVVTHAPQAKDLIDALSQCCGSVSVEMLERAGDESGTRKRRHGQREKSVVITIDALQATVTVDAVRGETVIDCDSSESARRLLMQVVQRTARNER